MRLGCAVRNCPDGWTLYAAAAGGFCCSGTVNGDTCSAYSCAVDGNLNNNGQRHCSTVLRGAVCVSQLHSLLPA
jgi:hypothetical protein